MKKVLFVITILLLYLSGYSQTSKMFDVQVKDKYGDIVKGERNRGCRMETKNEYGKIRYLDIFVLNESLYIGGGLYDDDQYWLDVKGLDLLLYTNERIISSIRIFEIYDFLVNAKQPIKILEEHKYSQNLIFTMSVTCAKQTANLIKQYCNKAIKEGQEYLNGIKKYEEFMKEEPLNGKITDISFLDGRYASIIQNGDTIFRTNEFDKHKTNIDYTKSCTIEYISTKTVWGDSIKISNIRKEIDSCNKIINSSSNPICTFTQERKNELEQIKQKYDLSKYKESSKKYSKAKLVLSEIEPELNLIYKEESRIKECNSTISKANELQKELNNELKRRITIKEFSTIELSRPEVMTIFETEAKLYLSDGEYTKLTNELIKLQKENMIQRPKL